MTTSGTTTFNLDVVSLIEEAFERAGAELRTGHDMRTARRSLNLLTIEWANRGINLWTVEEGTIPLVEGRIEYGLPADTVDLIEYVVRTGTGQNQTDLSMNRISTDTYATIPNKNATGRPLQINFRRFSGAVTPTQTDYPTAYIWPAPDQSDYYTLVTWRLRRIQDAGNGNVTPDIPFRFLPALVAGLAYYIALKLPESLDRVPLLKQIYDEQWGMAADEDREKATLRIVPYMRGR